MAGFILLFSIFPLQGIGYPAEPITQLSSRKGLHHLKLFYAIPGFKLGGAYKFGDEASYGFGGEGGVTLESLGEEPLRAAYIAVGRPERDKDGKIINAVVINSYYAGDATDMLFFWYDGQPGTEFSQGAVVGPGKLIDTERYFVIFMDSLGLWGASKPSDGLGLKFPDYSYMDIVQANYRLLKDKLGVGKIRLAAGGSMGGSLCYVWAALHPDFVEAILPIGANSSPDNVARWSFMLMNEAVKSDPMWQQTGGNYYHLPKKWRPKKGLMFAWSILELTAHDFNYRVEEDWEKEVLPYVFAWEPKKDEGRYLERRKDLDANDIIVRNRTCLNYDINDQLHRIKAKTLIVHATNDLWVIFKTVKWTADKIPGAKIACYEHPLAHYSIFRAPHLVQNEILAFFKEAGLGCSHNEKSLRKFRKMFSK